MAATTSSTRTQTRRTTRPRDGRGRGRGGAHEQRRRIRGRVRRLLAHAGEGPRRDGRRDNSAIASGIVWAVDHGARVINMSLGGQASTQTLVDAVAYAAAKGVVLVAAAGNSGSTTLTYPAALPQVIGVAGTTESDALYSWRARPSRRRGTRRRTRGGSRISRRASSRSRVRSPTRCSSDLFRSRSSSWRRRVTTRLRTRRTSVVSNGLFRKSLAPSESARLFVFGVASAVRTRIGTRVDPRVHGASVPRLRRRGAASTGHRLSAGRT